MCYLRTDTYFHFIIRNGTTRGSILSLSKLIQFFDPEGVWISGAWPVEYWADRQVCPKLYLYLGEELNRQRFCTLQFILECTLVNGVVVNMYCVCSSHVISMHRVAYSSCARHHLLCVTRPCNMVRDDLSAIISLPWLNYDLAQALDQLTKPSAGVRTFPDLYY